MREAIGASWLMVITMVFIALFSSYLAFSINYSRAFRVKDGIVDRIEKHNGIVRGSSASDDTLIDISEFMNEIGYKGKGSCKTFASSDNSTYAGVTGTELTVSPDANEHHNYCLQKVNAYFRSDTSAMNSAYYRIVVFFSLSLGQIDLFSNFHITGETTTMYFPSNSVF